MRQSLFFVFGCVLFTVPLFAEEGASVFEKRCKLCHSVAGSGGPMAKMGGPLDGIGSKHDAAWLEQYLKNPKSKEPQVQMPVVKLTDQERDSVVQYLLSLR
jgi:cytochrome c2